MSQPRLPGRAGMLHFVIEQGADFLLEITWKDAESTPIDLTGYTARIQIRPHASSDQIYLELTTENGRIALGGAEGTIHLHVNAEDTAGMNWYKGHYQLEMESPAGIVTRLLQGTVTVDPEITR